MLALSHNLETLNFATAAILALPRTHDANKALEGLEALKCLALGELSHKMGQAFRSAIEAQGLEIPLFDMGSRAERAMLRALEAGIVPSAIPSMIESGALWLEPGGSSPDSYHVRVGSLPIDYFGGFRVQMAREY